MFDGEIRVVEFWVDLSGVIYYEPGIILGLQLEVVSYHICPPEPVFVGIIYDSFVFVCGVISPVLWGRL